MANILGSDRFNDNISTELWGLIEHAPGDLGRRLAEEEYKKVVDRLCNGERPSYDDAIGQGRIAIIPGNSRVECRPILFALARVGSGRHGAKTIIEEMRRYLIKCAGTVQVACFFAPLPDIGKALNGSISDIEAHIRQGTLKEFVPIAVFNNRLTMINWTK